MMPSTFAASVTVVGDGVAGIQADRRRVIQIIRNVLDNARKYGGALVTVDVKAGEGSVVVRIGDDGPGIELNQVAKVFEAFGQLDEHGRQGSGLGLAISSKLADAMGGSLSYDGGGVGATFVLDLPAGTLVDQVDSSVSVGERRG